jgi:hypothetical protein
MLRGLGYQPPDRCPISPLPNLTTRTGPDKPKFRKGRKRHFVAGQGVVRPVIGVDLDVSSQRNGVREPPAWYRYVLPSAVRTISEPSVSTWAYCWSGWRHPNEASDHTSTVADVTPIAAGSTESRSARSATAMSMYGFRPGSIPSLPAGTVSPEAFVAGAGTEPVVDDPAVVSVVASAAASVVGSPVELVTEVPAHADITITITPTTALTKVDPRPALIPWSTGANLSTVAARGRSPPA